MKNCLCRITLLLLTLAPVAAFSTVAEPDLSCRGSAGRTYNVHYRAFTEIIISQDGEPIDYLDSMRAIFRGKMLYYIHEESDFVAAFRIKQKTAVGRVRKDRVYCQLL